MTVRGPFLRAHQGSSPFSSRKVPGAEQSANGRLNSGRWGLFSEREVRDLGLPARYVTTPAFGIAVQAASGVGRGELQEMTDAALHGWPLS
ncbi:hypothetical protein ACFTTN_23460 [Streptomyces niveus]|uniref:hypothetical protein n=1 Tax=Streptomyces niveus TaxID=193462 RepID=UPI003626A8B4